MFERVKNNDYFYFFINYFLAAARAICVNSLLRGPTFELNGAKCQKSVLFAHRSIAR